MISFKHRLHSLAIARLFGATLALSAAGCGGENAVPGETDPPPLPTFDYPLDDVLRLNHVQMKGTHNSYHTAPEGAIEDWRYTHAPLDIQLSSQGVRKVELDIHYNEAQGIFEVYHIAFLDEGTTCRRLTDCLKIMKTWSDKRAAHHTLFVQIEPKDGFIAETAEDYFKRFEDEVLSVWPRERIVTPDVVKGGAASLREAITTTGWPTLGEGRAKILFFMDNSAEFRDHYTHGGKDLDGRIMFAASDFGTERPYDAVYVLNNPLTEADAIAGALAGGFIVRTRADGDNQEPLAGDTSKRDAALASGAQIVSTDYPAPVMGIDYVVEMPGGAPSRCSSATAPAECSPEAIEDPKFMAAP
jgi:hypothetical protein